MAVQSRFLVILTVAGLLSIPTANWAQDSQVQERAPTARPVAASVKLDEMSPGQVIVTYENGYLTIKARNVPLLEVLRFVCKEIGAECDLPAGPSEPTFADLGPGPAREVLSSFLSGSRFNYVMSAADENPNILARLVLLRISGRPETQDRAAALEASAIPPTPPGKDVVNPQEAAAQMKNLVAEIKDEITEWASDDNQSDKEGTAQLLNMLENSMKTPAANASQAADGPIQPSPSAPSGTGTPRGRPSHRRR